jgi:nucleoside-diphosphate-sugar epimerase
MLDTTRAKELLGFEAETPLQVGLGATIDWYRERSRRQETRSVSSA